MKDRIRELLRKLELEAAYYAEGTCWGWYDSLLRTRETIKAIRGVLEEAERIDSFVIALAERIAAQSELLSRKAEADVPGIS